jgi:hypothetical protein
MSPIWIFPIAYLSVGSLLAVAISGTFRGEPWWARAYIFFSTTLRWPFMIRPYPRDKQGGCMCPNCVSNREAGR